nr:integrase, catalytic region, zinc finger, CCHC-type, peptidase aspartic, catalytic [Tanacetum cinerariifolium]
MEEYIMLEEEKARKREKVFNWEIGKYGKIWYDEDVQDLRFVKTEFPSIVFNDNLTSDETLSCEPTVSSLNDNEIDFRISFDESDDEDYTVVNMDDPNITMKEYIMLEEEKARKRRKEFKWETAKYGKIWDDEDVHDLRFVKTEFPAIVFNDNLTSDETLSCEPTVSSLNDNEIDFRISFDDEDYTVVFDQNLFSYKIISANDLKTDSENDNEKVNMPLFLSPEPSVSCIDDLDFFKDFEAEFPAIVYNDALTKYTVLAICQIVHRASGLSFLTVSIDEGPFQMEMFRETLAEGEEGAFHLGPERPQVYSDLSPEEKDKYNAEIQETNILLQGLPKVMYTLINHYTDAKDMRDNVKMLLEGLELTKEDRESQLYDDFEHFRQHKCNTPIFTI